VEPVQSLKPSRAILTAILAQTSSPKSDNPDKCFGSRIWCSDSKSLHPFFWRREKVIETKPGWAGLRILVIALCFLLSMLDGADMLIMSFVAPRLAEQWSVSPEKLGVIFSASLAGMAIGCLFLAPLADRFGRRRMILAALAVVAVAMILSGYVTSVPQLMLARLFVGIGVGTIGVSMTAMASEYAPSHASNFGVGFVQAGWPLAAVMTAFIAAKVIPVSGWQIMLVSIGIMSAALLVLVWFTLPESMAFLEKRQPAGALEALNSLRARLAEAPLAALPPPASSGRTFSVSELFGGARARTSTLLWSAVTLGYFVLYFVISWIPKLASQAGLPIDQAIYAGATYNAGAFIGTTAIGWLTVHYQINRVIALFFGGAAIAMMIFGGVSMPVIMTLIVAGAIGLLVGGGFNGFWGLAANLYPPEIRGTGIGWALGVGRIGAVLGPIVGGLLVGAKLPIATIFAIYTVPLIFAAILCLIIKMPQAES
jgi:benzoate transport